jgi:hypothetical protein
MGALADPIIAIIGNLKTDLNAPAVAEVLGRELAKAGFRILVYSSGEDFLEGRIVRGYVGSRVAARRSIQVRYPLPLLCHLRSGALLRKLSSMPNSRRLWMMYSSPMISRTHPRTTGRVGRGSSEPSPRSICRKVNATAVRTT